MSGGPAAPALPLLHVLDGVRVVIAVGISTDGFGLGRDDVQDDPEGLCADTVERGRGLAQLLLARTPVTHREKDSVHQHGESGRVGHREKRRLRIDDLPHDLNEACNELEKNDVITSALGDHIAQHFLAAKRQEWREYISQVSQWELDNYLGKY